jgi:hypothetical protein
VVSGIRPIYGRRLLGGVGRVRLERGWLHLKGLIFVVGLGY